MAKVLAVFMIIFLNLAFHTGLPFAADNGKEKIESGDAAALAAVDGGVITVGEFKEEVARRQGFFPGRGFTNEELKALLEGMVRFEILYIAAVRAGYDKDPAILEGMRRMIVSKYFEDNLEAELSEIKVTDEEMTAYYEENKERFSAPKRVRGAVIQIAVPKKASEGKRAELLKRAEAARAEALRLPDGTQSFGGAAAKYSDDQSSRYTGGDIGLVSPEEGGLRWDNAVVEALFSLKEPGDVSPVVSAPDGYYVLKLMEVKEKSIKPFPDVKGEAGRIIFKSKKDEIEGRFFERLAGDIKVKIDGELLKGIGADGAGRVQEPPAMPRR